VQALPRCDLAHQCRLASLTRPSQQHHRRVEQRLSNAWFDPAREKIGCVHAGTLP
jgi:hypothetical protein